MSNEANFSNIELSEEDTTEANQSISPKGGRLTIKFPSNFQRSLNRPGSLLNSNRARTAGSINSTSRIDDELLQIMRKDDRTDEEAWMLYENLKDYKFFNLFTNVTNELYQKECLIHIFKRLRYEEVPARQLIFEEGDASNGKMYIVLSGDCLVMKRTPDTVSTNKSGSETGRKTIKAVTHSPQKSLFRTSIFVQQCNNSDQQNEDDDGGSKQATSEELAQNGSTTPFDERKLMRNSTMFGGNSPMRRGRASPRKFSHYPREEGFEDAAQMALRNIQLMREERERQRLDIFYYGRVINSIGKGGFFGERALEANQKRSASIITERDCEILILNKEDYMLIKKTFRNKLRDLFNFVIDNLPGLHYLQSPLLSEHFVYIFEEKVLSIKNHVFHEGDSGENFYLIYSGTCEVYRTVCIDETPAVPGRLGKARPFFNKTKKIKEKIPLTIINQGYLIGEELLDPNNEASSYKYSVQVTSDTCRLLAINKERFKSKFSNEAFEEITAFFKEKKSHKEQLLSDQLIKRDLEVLEVQEDEQHFISTRRKAPQTIVVDTNKHQSFYNSYKRIAPLDAAAHRRSSTLETAEDRFREASLESRTPPTASPKKIKSPGLGSPLAQDSILNAHDRGLDFLRENKLFAREKVRRESYKNDYSPKLRANVGSLSTMASSNRHHHQPRGTGSGKSKLVPIPMTSDGSLLKGKLMNHLANSQSAANLLGLKICAEGVEAVEEEEEKNNDLVKVSFLMNASISKGMRSGLDSKDRFSEYEIENQMLISQELPTEEKPFIPLLPGLGTKDSFTKNEVYTTNSVLNTPLGRKTGDGIRGFGPQKSREHLNLNLPNRFYQETTLNDSKMTTTFALHNSKTYYPAQNSDYYEGMSVLLDKKMKSNKKNFMILNSSQQSRLQKFVTKMNNIPTKRIERNGVGGGSLKPIDRIAPNNVNIPNFLKPISQSPLKIGKIGDKSKITPRGQAFTPGLLRNVSMEDMFFSGMR